MSEPTGQPGAVKTSIAKARMESIGADVDINLGTYVTRITAYNLGIDLGIGSDPTHGQLKRIYNDSGSTVVITSDINVQGAATNTITLASTAGTYIDLIYLNDADITERFREIDQIGATFS